MAVKKWAFFYQSPGFSPEKNTTRIKSSECEFISVGFDESEMEKCLEVAVRLEQEGVEMFELCGAFGPLWMIRINEAVGQDIPVGSVFYGSKDRKKMLEITGKL